MARKRRDPNSLPVLTKKLDAVFSKWVRYSAADEYGMVKCFTCDHVSDPKKLQAGHWIPRQHKATRWMEWNCKPQCYADNMFYSGKPQEFRHQLVLIYGEEQVAEFALRRHLVKKWTREELKGMIADYTAKLDCLEYKP